MRKRTRGRGKRRQRETERRKRCSTDRHRLKHFKAGKRRQGATRPAMESNDPTLSNKTSALLPSPSTWPALYRSYFGRNRLHKRVRARADCLELRTAPRERCKSAHEQLAHRARVFIFASLIERHAHENLYLHHLLRMNVAGALVFCLSTTTLYSVRNVAQVTAVIRVRTMMTLTMLGAHALRYAKEFKNEIKVCLSIHLEKIF